MPSNAAPVSSIPRLLISIWTGWREWKAAIKMVPLAPLHPALGSSKTSQHGQVCTGNRPFPARSLTNEQWVTMLKPIALAEYVRKISPRMYALERAEPPPRVIRTCSPNGV